MITPEQAWEVFKPSATDNRTSFIAGYKTAIFHTRIAEEPVMRAFNSALEALNGFGCEDTEYYERILHKHLEARG